MPGQTIVDLGLPAITLGTNPSVCQGVTTADLSYSATTFSPDQYSIDWDGTAEGQGFSDVNYASLPSSPITLVIPAGAASGTYSGTLTVSKSSNGCESIGDPITVTVYALPVALNLTGSTICTLPGGNGTVSTSTSESGVSYQLYDGSNNSVQSPQSGTGSGLTWSNLSAGTGYYVVGTSGNSCTSTSNSVDIATYPNPTCSITGDDGPLCPGSSNVYTSTNGMSTYAWSITGNGSISGSTSNQSVTVIAGANCDETFTLSLDITDGNGCTSDCEKIVNVNDTEDPTASNPAPITLTGCNGTFPAPDITVVTDEADNCGTPTVAWVSDGTPSLVGCTETTVRTYSVTDDCGNSINVVQNLIRTVDTQDPTASNPADINLTGCNGAFPAPDISVVTDEADNCGTPTVAWVSDGTPSLVGCTETTVRTYSVTDDCGNSINVVQNLIRTVDTQDPTASNPADINLTGCNGAFQLQISQSLLTKLIIVEHQP